MSVLRYKHEIIDILLPKKAQKLDFYTYTSVTALVKFSIAVGH